VRVKVWRGIGEEGHFEPVDVPFEEGMSVLDALRWIRAHVDSSLAIRYSCLNANACHTCMALVDGRVEYTCTARLTPAGVTVGPLPKRRVIRDLVTDTMPAEEKLG
jgi:succinate dehydrogenase / fumarate reductase iron-sulfur subunit